MLPIFSGLLRQESRTDCLTNFGRAYYYPMEGRGLTIEPINLRQDSELCVQFRQDSFVVSFGSSARFFPPDGPGPEGYLLWLSERMHELPGCCVHAKEGNIIVGQIELGFFHEDPQIGYVYLYYLIPSHRSLGLGEQLEAYAENFFREHKRTSMRLRVSPTNIRAMHFYERRGWSFLSSKVDEAGLLWMGKVLS